MLLRILVVFLLSCPAFGQSVITVVSTETTKPVPFAHINYLEGDSTIASGMTDGRGSYTFPITDFTAKAVISFSVESAGFEPAFFQISLNEAKKVGIAPTGADLDEVVITGQLSSRSADESVQKIRVIDRAAIDARGAVNLKDVLQSQLSIRISQDQVLGSGMSLQGLSGQNVKILIDGVPVIGRVDGEIDLSQINLATIERIELVEGPSSVSYGSNALAGTINLITKKKDKPGQNLQLSSYYETVGNYNLDLRLSTGIRKSALQVYGQRNYFDGWNETDPFAELPREKIADSGRFQTWKPKLQYQAGFKWLFRLKRASITPYFDYFYEQIHNRGLPRAPYYYTAFDDFYTTNRTNQGVLIEVPVGQKFRVQGVVAYNFYERNKNSYLKNLTTLDQQLTTVPGDQDTTKLTAVMSRMSFVKNEKDSRVNYEIGYDFNQETAFGRRILDSRKTITEAALFSNVELQLKKLVIKPGLRATYNSGYRSSFTPAINLKYATGKWNYRLGIASGFRSPAIKELYLDFVDINHNIKGNSTLKPEQSLHYQLWVGTKRMIRSQPLQVDVNGYYQHVNNRISLSQDAAGVTYSYFNLDEFEAVGVQSAVDYSPGRHQIKLGFAYMGTRSNLTVNGFACTPELTAAASVFLKKPGILLSTFYKYTGRVLVYVESYDAAPQQVFINHYNMLDFSASRDCWKQKMTITIGGKNLLNVTRVNSGGSAGGAHSGSASSTPIGWGRSIYVKLQFNLNYKR